MAESTAPVEVFCCYSHKDETWLRKLETHLSLLKRRGLVSLWHDRLIAPGADWTKAIDTHMEMASVILLLVSADFLASDYCYSIEMQRALERDAAGEARIVPILVRPVDWKSAPFAHLQALPTDARPISSWRNQDRAMADVAAGIRRVIEDMSLLAASAPRAALPMIWNIPYPRNPFFLGRDAELAQMRSYLQDGQATALSQPQAISGLGGIGKTQLALEYAYRYHQDYQAVLWARAENTETLISSYVAIASLIQLPEREAKEQEIIVQAVKTWLQTHRDWLLILDNADELAIVPNFLPASRGGHVLLTTRAAATGRLAHRLEVQTLFPEQGALLLLRRAGYIARDGGLSQASYRERELAAQISQEIGGLPLALDQAGAYLDETGMDLASYQQFYQQHRAMVLQERRDLVNDHPSPVATTWLLSFQRLEERNPAAAELLRLLAFLAPDAIAEEILTAGASMFGPILAPVAADTFLLNQAIEALRAYSLVRRDPKEKTLSIHRLVQFVLQERLEETERHTWAERALLAVNAAFPHAERETWPKCERLLPQALAATQGIKQYQTTIEKAGHLLAEAASYLQTRARHAEAEQLYHQALRIWEQQLGAEHPAVVYPLSGLAMLYRWQSKFEQAELLYQRALHIWEQQLGPEHPAVVYPLSRLAELYSMLGKYARAEPLYQRALRLWEQQLSPEHSSEAYPLDGLAGLYTEQGKYVQAGPLYQRALRLWGSWGLEYPGVSYPLIGLARLYGAQDKDVQAESLYQRALHIWEQLLGPEHPAVAYPLDELARLYQKQGKYEQAEQYYQQALHIWEQQGREDLGAITIDGLAGLYHEQGKYAQAESLYQRALRIWEQLLGPEHPDDYYPPYRLASLYLDQGKYEAAELLYQRALRASEQVPGDAFRSYLLTGLASLYQKQGRYEAAKLLYQRALRLLEQTRGPEHPAISDLLTELASLCQDQGEYEAAKLLYQRALRISEQTCGPEHSRTAGIIHGIAIFQEAQGNKSEAKSLYARALAVRERVLGAHHPKTVETRTRLIALLHTLGQHEEAAKLEATQAGP